MDAELLELQKLFQATQEAKTTVRLSERNVVELVTKLQDLHLLDSDLLHTVSGKEYITKERLVSEVEAEVGRLGRVSLTDLATSIGVELVHCEKVAEQLVAKNTELILVHGEVLSTKYWDAVAAEVNETLQESGQVAMGELARRFNLGTELLTRMLESRLGISIHGTLEGGQLYTQAYVDRVKAMVRGTIRAIMVPTPLSTIWASLQKQLREMDGAAGGPAESGLFQSVLHSLISEGEIKGSLRGGGSSWTPGVFAHSQRESVEAYFSQNGYISYDNLRKLAILQPKVYLQEKFPEGCALETVFIHPSLISMLDAAAEEAITGGGWVDAMLLAPTSFGTADTSKLVTMCPSVQKAMKESTGVVLAETCILSASFIKTLYDKLEAEIRASNANTVEQHIQSSGNGEVDTVEADKIASSSKGFNGSEQDVDSGEATHGKNTRKKKTSNGPYTSKKIFVEDVEEDSSGRGGKNNRKTGRGKGGIGLLIGEAGNGASRSSKGSLGKGNGPSDDTDIPSEEQIAEEILEWFPDMRNAGAGEERTGTFALALATWVRPSLVASRIAAKRASFTASSEERRRRLDSLQQRIDEAYGNLQLFSKSVDLFEDDKATSVILHKHLLRTTAAQLTDMLLASQNLDALIEDGRSFENLDNLSTQPLSSAQRMSLAKNTPGRVLSSKAVEMVDSLEGKNIKAFESAFEVAVFESGLRCKKLDKKAERALLHSHRKSLSAQVDEETDPIGLLPKVVALLFIQLHSRALQAPGRAMASAVQHLKSGIAESSFGILVEYHTSTVQFLAMQSTASNDENCTSDRLRTRRESLEKRMPELKSLVLPIGSSGSSRGNSAKP